MDSPLYYPSKRQKSVQILIILESMINDPNSIPSFENTKLL
ncbi:hypothetical protein [Clostridium sp.]